LKACILLAIGALLGVWIANAFAPATSLVAQDKTGAGAEDRLRELKLELPPVTKPANTFVNTVRVGDMLYVSGTGPSKGVVGRLGQDFDVKQGKAAARDVGLHVLAAVKAELGSLDKVERLVKTLGMVNSSPDFKQQPLVINGFSDLMVEIFGEKNGKGTRSAVGMAALPNGIPVEIECILQVRR
jgi:enamine deaminase RidA (YjgF/YER057c/UK114 family)